MNINSTSRVKEVTDEILSSVNMEGIVTAFKADNQVPTPEKIKEINDIMIPFIREEYPSLHICFIKKAYKNGIIGEEKYASGRLTASLFLKWINQISSEMLRAHQVQAERESEQRRREYLDPIKPTGNGGFAYLLRYYYLAIGEDIPSFERRLKFVLDGKNDKEVSLEIMLATAGNPDWSKLVVKKVNGLKNSNINKRSIVKQ